MDKKNNKMIQTSIITVLTVCMMVFSGCDGNSNIIDGPGSTHKYTLNGFFVQDVNLTAQKPNYNHFAVQMTRNTVDLSTAQLFFGTSALTFGTTYNITDSVYTYINPSVSYKQAGIQVINIVDSTLFTDTITTRILDSVYITNYPDSTIPNTNGTPIFLEWSKVLNVQGYVVAVVLTNSAYTGAGFSAYATDQTSSTNIPPDAFRANINQTLDTGWYDIYVYGYIGVPDFELSSAVLPVPLPTQLPDNISHVSLSGHFGSIVVSHKKMIHVVSN